MEENCILNSYGHYNLYFECLKYELNGLIKLDLSLKWL